MKYNITSIKYTNKGLDIINLVYDELVCEMGKPLKLYHKDLGWASFEGEVTNILEDEYGVLIQTNNCEIRVDYVSGFSESLLACGLRTKNFMGYTSEDLLCIAKDLNDRDIDIQISALDKYGRHNKEAIDKQVSLLRKCKHDLISKVNSISEYIDYVYEELDEEELL